MRTTLSLLTALTLTAGCGGSSLPPTVAAELETFLSEGSYKDWACEPAAHDARSPSPHGKNRICSNDVLSAHGAGAYPVDSATVKEIYDAAGTSIIGYAVLLKTTTATTSGAWYAYERVTGMGVVADGMADSGPALTICAGCHNGAGIDAQHSGHDFIYTQVK